MENILFSIIAQDQFSPTFDKLKNKLNETEASNNKLAINNDKLNLSVSDLQGGIGGLISKFTSIAPVIGIAVTGIAALTKTITECTKAAIEAEAVQTRFNMALQLAEIPANIRAGYTQFATELQRISGVSDEVIKSAMSLGLTMGITSNDIFRATEVAMNLSAALGTDLSTAMRYVGQAMEGNLSTLGRYIPSLKELNTEGMSTSEILALIGGRVEGMSAAMGETAQGSLSRLKETFGDLKENIGSKFLPALKSIADWLTVIIEKINILFFNVAKNTMTVNVNGKTMSLGEAQKEVNAATYKGSDRLMVIEGQKIMASVAKEAFKVTLNPTIGS